MIDTFIFGLLTSLNVIFSCSMIIVFLTRKSGEVQYLNETLGGEYIKNAKLQSKILELEKQSRATPVIGVIEKYTEDEIEELKGFIRALDIVVKVLTYNAAIATDKIRMPLEQNEDREEVVGRANNAHEQLFFFWKILMQAKEDIEKKSGQTIE